MRMTQITLCESCAHENQNRGQLMFDINNILRIILFMNQSLVDKLWRAFLVSATVIALAGMAHTAYGNEICIINICI